MRRWRVFPVVPPGVAARGACASLFATACALLASACGSATQAAHERRGDYPVKVLDASFPAVQTIAKPTKLELQVQNTGSRTVPDVAVSLDSFYYVENYPELAADKRPVWVVDAGPGTPARVPVQSQEVSPPGGAQTAYVNTWALGPLAAGRTQTFVWQVVPVKAGKHTVHFTVGAGLAGNARAVLSSGNPVRGTLTADIAPKPATRHVDPNTGKVVPGASPAIP